MNALGKMLSMIRAAGRLWPPRRGWWVGGAAAAALAVFLVARASLTRLGQSYLSADWRWMAVTLALLFLSLVLRSVALKVVVDALGGVRARLTDTFSATSVGLLANIVAPIRVGTVLAPYTLFVLLRRRGVTVPFATALGVALTERLFAMATFVALSLLFISVLPVPAWALQMLLVSAAFAATLLVGGLALERRRRTVAARGARATEAGAGRAAGRGGLRRHWPALVDSQRIMGKPWRAAAVGATQMIGWLTQVGAAWAALQAFHLEASGLRGAALVLVLTNLIGLLPLTPGNLGTFQAATVAALAASGVAAGPAVAYALGLQGMQLIVGAAAGLASLSLHDLTLADLRARSREAASLLSRGEQGAPSPADELLQP